MMITGAISQDASRGRSHGAKDPDFTRLLHDGDDQDTRDTQCDRHHDEELDHRLRTALCREPREQLGVQRHPAVCGEPCPRVDLVGNPSGREHVRDRAPELAHQTQPSSQTAGLDGNGAAVYADTGTQQFAAQPTAVGEDQNQPMTQAGSVPAAAGQGPAQTGVLIRNGTVSNQQLYQSGGR